SIKNIMKGIVPERFLDYILKVNQVDEDQKAANTSRETIHQLVQHIKNFTFHVNGSLPIEKAFVKDGVISTKEIIQNNNESKFIPRLFFSGEILDIHDYRGGYNITSALSTGKLAGMNAAIEAY